MTRSAPQKLDSAERADLLCFLVIAQLVAYARTTEWLRMDHVVEAAHIWSTSSSIDCDWIERAKLAQMSADLAPTFLAFPCFRDAKELVKLLADGWQLDYRSPTVRGMLNVCVEHLTQHQ